MPKDRGRYKTNVGTGLRTVLSALRPFACHPERRANGAASKDPFILEGVGITDPSAPGFALRSG